MSTLPGTRHGPDHSLRSDPSRVAPLAFGSAAGSLRSRGGRLFALALIATLAALFAPSQQAAAAGGSTPSRPHGEHVVLVGRHTLKIVLPKIKNARRYRLYVATRPRDLRVARIGHARHSASSTKPRLTARHLPNSASRYYYRVRATNGAKSRWGRVIKSVALRPATPTSVRVTSSRAGTFLTWRGATGTYQVVQARNRAMTSHARTFTLRATTGGFTPYGATPGRTYWYRMRTVRTGTPSTWSATVHTVVRSRLQPVRIMTYNVLTSAADGKPATDGAAGSIVAPWSKRRAGVVALIRRAAPDVLCLQEGGGWVGDPKGYGGRRQVDDLLGSLPGYALARTETPPSEHHYQRFGNYVLYRTSVYRELATRGHWDLGDGRTAAYQLLQQRVTGARVLAVSVHLMYGPRRPGDDLRAAETRRLLAQAGATSRRVGAPVVYAGDFNTAVNKNHVYDGPGSVMRAARILDARNVAQSQVNATYNSANLYLRVPPRVSQSIDYVFAPLGVAVAARAVLLDLRGGRFPGVIPSDHNPLLVTGAYPY